MKMPRAANWPKIREAYEAGAEAAKLAVIHGIKAWKIRERADAEQWGPNAGEDALRVERARKAQERAAKAAKAGSLVAMPEPERQALDKYVEN